MENELIRWLRGVVYRMKRRGPRTEPCGTPQARLVGMEDSPEARTEKKRDDKYELIQSRDVPEMPNQELSLARRMLWSIVSKAALISRRQRQETFCWPTDMTRLLCKVVRRVSVE